jgi:hypothetical protein
MTNGDAIDLCNRVRLGETDRGSGARARATRRSVRGASAREVQRAACTSKRPDRRRPPKFWDEFLPGFDLVRC